MKTIKCFFIGHADTPEDIFPGLDAAIKQQITLNGVTEFYVGNHGRFDILVYRALRTAKRRHPHIRCYLVTAYHPEMGHIDAPVQMDGVFYPADESIPRCCALDRANRVMIDSCDYLIAAVWRAGNARKLLEYAQCREERGLIRITNLMDE